MCPCSGPAFLRMARGKLGFQLPKNQRVSLPPGKREDWANLSWQETKLTGNTGCVSH